MFEDLQRPFPTSAMPIRRKRLIVIGLAPAVLLLFVLCQPAHDDRTDEAVIASGTIEVRLTDGKLEIIDREAGVLLADGMIVCSGFAPDRLQFRKNDDGQTQRLHAWIDDLVTIDLEIAENGVIGVEAGCPKGGFICFTARAGPGAVPVITKNRSSVDQKVLVTALGPARIKGATSVFFPQSDTVLSCSPYLGVDCKWFGDGSFRAEPNGNGTNFSFGIGRHYFRDRLDIEFYSPMEKRSYWNTAPMVAMTWYGIEGWKGRPAQRREWLEPQADWVAENLLPFAENLIFQLDDNYPHNDNAFMRDLSDMIRSKGLIPGIWFTPFGVAPRSVSEEHPDWFLQDTSGKTLTAFGGVNFSDEKGAPPVLNVTSPEAVANWYAMFWKRASEDWNFDFFKIDGQPTVEKRYRESANGDGVAGYRKGLEIGRDVVGPDKFINGCWGTPLDALGIVDGSRTGPDTGNWPHATGVVLRWNFLNNFCWWSDPDAAANLFKATVERTRHNAQARVLTGQQFLTDDVWTEVPAANLDVWQRSHPTLDIRPVNLYPIEDWKEYDLFDLRIAKPWKTWDVVGLFNYDGTALVKEFDLGRLPLESPEVHVYEYWTATHVGRFDRDGRINRFMAPHGGQLFSIVPASSDRPDLISTSRHASQGGLDLDDLGWTKQGTRWIVRGKSSHLVPGTPYELVFALNNHRVVATDYPSASASIVEDGAVTRVVIDSGHETSAAWCVIFEPVSDPHLSLNQAELHLQPGGSSELYLNSFGKNKINWSAAASDPRIRIEPDSGTLGPEPDQAALKIGIDLTGLPPGTIWTGSVAVRSNKKDGPLQTCRLRALVPWPENLALRAGATASSHWTDNSMANFKASLINDGSITTRWNSVKGETQNAWARLDWDEPVTIDRVVIDECVDWGNRIQSWRLESGNFAEGAGYPWLTVARGEEAGRRRIVDLELPVTTRTLRLVVEKASEVPTIWELEAYRWRGEEK